LDGDPFIPEHSLGELPDTASGDLAVLRAAGEAAVDLSAQQVFTIANGANGSAVTPADLGANYRVVIIRCEDCQYIPATTTMALELGESGADTVCEMCEIDAPDTIWTSGNLPTSGTLRAVLTHAFGCRRVRVVLSKNSTGGSTVFTIAGADKLL